MVIVGSGHVGMQLAVQCAALCPSDVQFTTNTSYFVPSALAASTGRAELFAALRFRDPVWYCNVVEIMSHPRTAPETVERLSPFIISIGQIPIRVNRESPCSVFNALLFDLVRRALSLAERGVATYQDVDHDRLADIVSSVRQQGPVRGAPRTNSLCVF
jgi:3-hydroxybutyryl-CoA dehydrogenase